MNIQWMSNRLVHVAIVALALLVHSGLVLRSYPVRMGINNEVPLRGDVARYFATADGVAKAGGLYGYDPAFMAGYPVGLWNSMGKKGYEVLHLMLPWVPLPRLFYFSIVGIVLACPLVLWLLLRRNFERRGQQVFFLLLLLGFWHLSTQISYFWGFGNVFFPCASVLAIVMCVLLQRLTNRGRFPWLTAIGLGVVGAAIFYCHTVVLIAALVPLLSILLLGGSREQLLRTLPRLAVSLSVFAALSLPWLVPLLSTRDDCLTQPEQWFQGGPRHLIMDLFSDRTYRLQFDRNTLFHVAVVFGLAGGLFAWRDRRDVLLTSLAIGGAWALVITYGFTYLGALSSVQPYRFMIPATLFLLAPAAYAMVSCAKAVLRTDRRVQVGVVLLLLVLMPEVSAYVIDKAWGTSEIGLSTDREDVLSVVKELPREGRILCDDAGLGHVMPYFTGRAVIGGLSSQAFLKHRFAGIDEKGMLFGRMPSEWPSQKLALYLEAYAVDYAVFSSARWIKYADAATSLFVFERSVAGQRLYRVGDVAQSYVARGDARVRIDDTGIHLTEIMSTELLLKFHYSDLLSADVPGVTLGPEAVFEDPIPFVLVNLPEGVSSFSIRW
jgi:hypothetical protein